MGDYAPAERADNSRTSVALDQQETTVRWLGRLSPILVIAVPLAASATSPHPGLLGSRLVLTAALTVFVLAVIVRNATTASRTAAVHLAAVTAMGLSALAMAIVQPRGPAPECLLLAVVCVAVLLPAAVGTFVIIIGFGVVLGVASLARLDAVSLVVLLAFAAVYGLLYLAFKLAEANRRAALLVAELERDQAARTAAAGFAERQRLAREMHDVLAHSLSGLALQLEGARMLASRSGVDPRLRDAVVRAHRLGKHGLAEARQAISTLRDDALPDHERLEVLAARFEEDNGIACAVNVQGSGVEVGAQTQVALYRVTQEALTNVLKHAIDVDAVRISVAFEQDWTSLIVENVGAGPSGERHRPRGTYRHGYGLEGMRERAVLLGGTLTARVTETGFLVELRVPRPSQGTRVPA